MTFILQLCDTQFGRNRHSHCCQHPHSTHQCLTRMLQDDDDDNQQTTRLETSRPFFFRTCRQVCPRVLHSPSFQPTRSTTQSNNDKCEQRVHPAMESYILQEFMIHLPVRHDCWWNTEACLVTRTADCRCECVKGIQTDLLACILALNEILGTPLLPAHSYGRPM